MAIIKCPECGHQTSDKAPACPSCGVEIAGKIEKCPYCGEVYFKSEGVCPHCHKAIEAAPVMGTERKTETAEAPTAPEAPAAELPQPNGKDGKKRGCNAAILAVSVVIACIVLGVCAYFYREAKNDRELEEYEFAMSSGDPMVLQTYLVNFKDAPQEHIDSITAHIERLKAQSQEWTNAVVSGSKAALTEYMRKHPDSPHRQEALSKIDSIDWEQCSKTNTAEAYQLYIDNHSDGNHYDEALLALKKARSAEVSADERQVISNLFHLFFVSVNSKDEDGLTSTVSDVIDFLGKPAATKADIVTFMHKLYKPDVESLLWTLDNDYKIQKAETADGVYEFSVTFMASQKVTKTDGTTATTPFRVNAKVDSEGKISEMAMTKIIE